ncbi:MAG: FAD:protein FMN transferase [Deltaproteobacteria bacterium]|nr:FAD:protein FMN transferase [Deltaproteobacteria bacterium]
MSILLLFVAAVPTIVERHAAIMGTELVVRVVLQKDSDQRAAETAIDEVEVELRRLEALLSEWKPESVFGRLNAKPTEPVEMPAEAFSLLERSLEWSRRSEGAFDPTFASLWGLWRFDPDDAGRIPTPAEAKARASLIDYRAVTLDREKRTVRMKPRMKLGLGGIAKGYAVDRVVELLRRRSFENFFVKLGGELYLSGRRGDRPWIAGIQDPRNRESYFATLALENSAFTTSGDYERFLIKDGVRYHHIIDPSTGYPARKSRAVTIVAPRAEDADALSTSVFVLGPEKGMALVKSIPGVEAVIVDSAGKVSVSPGLEGKLSLKPLSAYEGP